MASPVVQNVQRAADTCGHRLGRLVLVIIRGAWSFAYGLLGQRRWEEAFGLSAKPPVLLPDAMAPYLLGRLVQLLGLSQTMLVAHSSQPPQQGCWRDTPCTGPASASFRGPWEANILAATSRTASPIGLVDQDVKTHVSALVWPVCLRGNGSIATLDFGLDVAGPVTVNFTIACPSPIFQLGLSFSESLNFTGYLSDQSNGGSGHDGYLNTTVPASACDGKTQSLSYTVPLAQQRGGFRYLSVFVLSASDAAAANVTAATTALSYQPSWPNLRAYGGYFNSSDALLNRIWYAGAYTVQLTAVSPSEGRHLQDSGWRNDEFLGTNASTILVDGAKRDRTAWPGDLAIAVRSALVSTGDLESARVALEVEFDSQATATGELPFAGPPLYMYGSDTYGMSTLLGAYDYLLFSGDSDFLERRWESFQKAMGYLIDKVDDSGMMNVTGQNTWGRTAVSGGHTTDGNMLLYRCLVTASAMAGWMKATDLATNYSSLAQSLKAAVKAANWDASVGAFKNSDTDASVHPEDGNSLALYYNGTDLSMAADVSAFLATQWTPLGAVTQELPGNIVPFIEGFEVKGHFEARQAQRAIDLMRASWGWYLNCPYGTGSTTIEGYVEDGSFRYREASYGWGGSYTSHAHTWSTGPTDALTSYVVGLRPVGFGAAEWVLAPQFGDLTGAEGGWTMPAVEKMVCTSKLHISPSSVSIGEPLSILWPGTCFADATPFKLWPPNCPSPLVFFMSSHSVASRL